MTRTHYSPRLGGIWLRYNSAQSASSVEVAYSKADAEAGRFEGTPFQVADGRHSDGEIAQMVARWAEAANE